MKGVCTGHPFKYIIYNQKRGLLHPILIRVWDKFVFKRSL
nr:MAG TPA: hypothetical protein [Caudoviricetes sp.]